MVICLRLLGFLIEFAVYLLVRQMLVLFYICLCFALSINFLVVTSPFINDLLLTHDHLEGLGYSLSVVLICCKVLVPFFFSLLLFCGFVSSLNPSSEILSLAPAKGLCLRQWLVPVEAGFSYLTYTHSRDICCV